jgi:hypothetical protein
MTERFTLTLAWLCAAAGAIVVGLYPVTASWADGQYVPVGPDGFYHARRILDAVKDPSAFFQFDPFTHVPEGNLVTWPWAYDFLMSLLVRLALGLGITADPMAVLVHLPVMLFPLAALLMLSICRSLRLPPALTLIAMLGTVLFPLNAAIYSIGNIDHHFAEHLFVLGSLAATLAWLRRPDSARHAVVCGLTLGLASGVHSALFVLQVPLLATLFFLWVRQAPQPGRMVAFAAALLIAQLAVALPSLALRLGQFNYYTLSWFQPYAAGCTAVAAVLLTRLPRTARGGAVLAAVSLALLAPMLGQVLYAGDFFSSSVGDMGDLIEVRSVWSLATQSHSFPFVAANYTWLIVLLPLTALLCARWLWRSRDPALVHLAFASLAGLALLLAQARLHYFGSYALFLPWLVWLANRWTSPPARLPLTLLAAVVMAAAWLPGLTSRVFTPRLLSEEPNYAATHQLYAPLAARCAVDPGVVLAHPYEGHYIRYHTDCAVMGNNFLVTPRDVAKVRETEQLLALSASRLRAAAPAVRYVMVRRQTIFVHGADGTLVFAPGEYPGRPEYPLVRELLAGEEPDLPEGFELIYEMRQGPAERPFARVLAIHRPPSTGTSP